MYASILDRCLNSIEKNFKVVMIKLEIEVAKNN